MRTLLWSAIWKGVASRELRARKLGAWRGAGLTLVLGAAFLGAATVASAETVTTEETVVLENGETVLEVSQLTADAVTTVAGTTIKCRKVHGWHGLKHPLFGYFYWKYILTIRWCWQAGGSLIVKTTNPWSPTYWRDVECCLQFSGWDFKGHTSPQDAAHIAAQAGVGRLVLVHLPPETSEEDLAEARESFPELYLGEDGARYSF